MKAIKYTLILLGLAAFFSCKSIDYPDRFVQTEGLPTVKYVRYANNDVIISQANMEEVVCLVGDNLTSIHDLYFNDQPAVLNTSYMTAHTLVVAVPKNAPKEETDKIYMYNRDGEEVTYDFKVLPPAPKIESMSNEWAKAGEKVTIRGSYFTEPLTVSFVGADPIELTSVPNSEVIEVTVPVGAQQGKIQVATASGLSQSVFMYKDTRGMLFDFDGITGLDNHGWNGHSSQDDDGTGVSGRFFQFGDGVTELTGAWEEAHFSFVYWPGTWNDPEDYAGAPRLTDLADFSSWQNMALKFEMCIPSANPWNNTPMQICFGGVDLITFGTGGILDIYGNTVAGQNNTYMSGNAAPRVFYKPWEATGSFDTGDKWITVSIPLTQVNKGWDGNTATAEVNAASFSSLWLFICDGGLDLPDASCTPIIKIDNIRAVPYK